MSHVLRTQANDTTYTDNHQAWTYLLSLRSKVRENVETATQKNKPGYLWLWKPPCIYRIHPVGWKCPCWKCVSCCPHNRGSLRKFHANLHSRELPNKEREPIQACFTFIFKFWATFPIPIPRNVTSVFRKLPSNHVMEVLVHPLHLGLLLQSTTLI